ncbi:hypothetical protein LP7551_01819 [Roseibium album]|nr:hypothetical protein LP7551_01819 [Roseibium album]
MSDDFDAAGHVAHMEKALGLKVEDDWRPVVEAHVSAIQKAAELVLETPMDDDVEAAPVFVP